MNSAAYKGRAVSPAAVGNGLPTGGAVWNRIVESSQFRDLVKAKRDFILPAFLLFAGYCLLMPLLTAFAPQVMASKVAGVSVAYWFGISVILLAWVIVWLYVNAAARFDVLANDIVVEAKHHAKKSE
ncbi:MAG: DUF485 domain-containing protein [Candidatus Korobacteraceae bacterium]|jgi:uncharacterized membrane protein (DUF485 family)